MGERDWLARYKEARAYADEQAAKYERGEIIEKWRQRDENDPSKGRETLTGAAWVAWAYEIAASDAKTLVQVRGKLWQHVVTECERLMQEYREKANH